MQKGVWVRLYVKQKRRSFWSKLGRLVFCFTLNDGTILAPAEFYLLTTPTSCSTTNREATEIQIKKKFLHIALPGISDHISAAN